MNALEVNNVTKIFPDGTKALNSVSFEIKRGEGVVLLGHNGSGKSTMFKNIAGFEKPSDGSIFINNKEITQLGKSKFKPIRKKLGMVFQNFHLIYNLSVFQNVLFGRMGYHRNFLSVTTPFASAENRERAMSCLERVGLAHLAGRRADQLSGGQQQRVAIARMLMQDPEIILADEPIASLDPKAGREVMELLWEIVEEKSWTVLCILHQTDIAMEFGERLIGLNKGEVVLDGSKKTISKKDLSNLYYHDELRMKHS
ncbi:MAG: phosphonate ABC transporter ATP-binding protein [Alkalicoccus sp.]|nr:MAG: phosphonate ABC transporter ATP-binding protein [Alkalicoccus sp.]